MVTTAMPDERVVMTYVSSYYHTFSGKQKVGIGGIQLFREILNRNPKKVSQEPMVDKPLCNARSI